MCMRALSRKENLCKAYFYVDEVSEPRSMNTMD